MAKGKHSVALFEVMQKDKRFERRPLLRSKPVAAAAPPLVPPKRPVPPKTPRTPLPVIARQWAARAGESLRPVWSFLRPHLASQTSILSGAGMALIVIFAVLTVRHLEQNAPTRTASAGSSLDEIRNSPADPSVLQNPVQHNMGTAMVENPAPDNLAQAAPATSHAPPTRTVNLNYLLVQSYGDAKTASEACDFLNRNGVPCTVERGIKNWRKDFYLVIGLQGFAHISSQEFINYRRRVMALSAQFAGPGAHYRGFTPLPIKWLPQN